MTGDGGRRTKCSGPSSSVFRLCSYWRDSMYDISKDLLDAFRAAPEIYEALLRGCTQEQAQSARGGDEGWSVVEVVCHLRDAEERALERMRALRDQPRALISGYNQEQWAKDRNYAAADLRAALAAFKQFREQHVD